MSVTRFGVMLFVFALVSSAVVYPTRAQESRFIPVTDAFFKILNRLTG